MKSIFKNTYLKLNENCNVEGFCISKDSNKFITLIYTNKYGTKYMYHIPEEIDISKYIVKKDK